VTRLPLALSGPFLMCVAFLGIKLVGGPILLWVGISAILWTLVLNWYLRSVEQRLTEHFSEKAALENAQQLEAARSPVGVSVESGEPLRMKSTARTSETRVTSWDRLDRVAHLAALWIIACLGWGLIAYSAAVVYAGGGPSLEMQAAVFVGALALGSLTAHVLAGWLARGDGRD